MASGTGRNERLRPAEGRDRDAAGRARNARLRDELGRPLAREAVRGTASADEAALPPADALASAQQLLDDGLPFHAHEILEAAWKAAPASERDLWQGLAQIAVGLTHARRGNARGAVALLRRGRDRLARYPAPGPHEVDITAITARCDELAVRIERAGLAGVTEASLQLRLVTPPGPS
ncbi:MAG: DUF309 domain-containing protein [Streptosporangiaceae bacterium]